MKVNSISAIISLALAPLAYATSNAIVTNNCPAAVYLWSVGGSVGPEQTINPGGSYSEPFRTDPTTGGIALKITRVENGLYDGHSPQLNFAYALDDGTVWYDISDVMGDPFAGSPVSLVPSDGSCGSITWASGTPPAGTQVDSCESGTDLTLYLC